MKKVFLILLALAGLGFVIYYSGPKPEEPDLSKSHTFTVPDDAEQLDKWLAAKENAVGGLKPGNAATIVWADSSKVATEYAIVYIHGFSASHEEGDPVHENLAKRYKANLYKARMYAHGIAHGTKTMAEFNADDYIHSGEEALAIGKKLGKKVILVGTSAGAAMSLFLASRHPEIEALVLYSPCIEIYDPTAKLLDDNWGLKIAETVIGKPYMEAKDEENNLNKGKFWATTYSLKALVGLQNFISHTMIEETFKQVKCPVFMGYYYKDEENQDKVVSVKAELRMFDHLGSGIKKKVAFPNANNHVLASWVVSGDVAHVQQETETFLDQAISN